MVESHIGEEVHLKCERLFHDDACLPSENGVTSSETTAPYDDVITEAEFSSAEVSTAPRPHKLPGVGSPLNPMKLAGCSGPVRCPPSCLGVSMSPWPPPGIFHSSPPASAPLPTHWALPSSPLPHPTPATAPTAAPSPRRVEVHPRLDGRFWALAARGPLRSVCMDSEGTDGRFSPEWDLPTAHHPGMASSRCEGSPPQPSVPCKSTPQRLMGNTSRDTFPKRSFITADGDLSLDSPDEASDPCDSPNITTPRGACDAQAGTGRLWLGGHPSASQCFPAAPSSGLGISPVRFARSPPLFDLSPLIADLRDHVQTPSPPRCPDNLPQACPRHSTGSAPQHWGLNTPQPLVEEPSLSPLNAPRRRKRPKRRGASHRGRTQSQTLSSAAVMSAEDGDTSTLHCPLDCSERGRGGKSVSISLVEQCDAADCHANCSPVQNASSEGESNPQPPALGGGSLAHDAKEGNSDAPPVLEACQIASAGTPWSSEALALVPPHCADVDNPSGGDLSAKSTPRGIAALLEAESPRGEQIEETISDVLACLQSEASNPRSPVRGIVAVLEGDSPVTPISIPKSIFEGDNQSGKGGLQLEGCSPCSPPSDAVVASEEHCSTGLEITLGLLGDFRDDTRSSLPTTSALDIHCTEGQAAGLDILDSTADDVVLDTSVAAGDPQPEKEAEEEEKEEEGERLAPCVLLEVHATEGEEEFAIPLAELSPDTPALESGSHGAEPARPVLEPAIAMSPPPGPRPTAVEPPDPQCPDEQGCQTCEDRPPRCVERADAETMTVTARCSATDTEPAPATLALSSTVPLPTHSPDFALSHHCRDGWVDGPLTDSSLCRTQRSLHFNDLSPMASDGWMTHGGWLLKYGQWGKPQFRWVRLELGGDTFQLTWAREPSGAPTKCFPGATFTALVLGANSAAFRRWAVRGRDGLFHGANGEVHDGSLCFSVHTTRRSIDFRASSQETFLLWTAGLRRLLQPIPSTDSTRNIT
eukprot:GGOE01041696.1.p1 GENE.GGOE01041696.1~~GGOE01041696.1.p1  ORF type:complete len:984 (-),score=102.21 GGOE01041696.1:213-3164(-)